MADTDGEQRVPTVICEADGRPIAIAYQNQKAFEKSIEQGHLWVLNGSRVLPYADTRPIALSSRDRWNLAQFRRSEVEKASEPELRGAEKETRDQTVGERDSEETAGREEVAVGEVESASPADSLGPVLTRLEALIADRKRDLPEGSYTTHLFRSGGEKIRKKLGEEAVELLLASGRERTVSEAADLIYHLLVFFAEQEISLGELARELSER